MNHLTFVIALVATAFFLGLVLVGLQVGVYWMGSAAVGLAIGEFLVMSHNLKEKK